MSLPPHEGYEYVQFYPISNFFSPDGVRCLDANSNRINARHNNLRTTNFLFADGHCESIPTDMTPVLTTAQWRGSNLTVFNQWPHPHWRLDQKGG